MPRRTPVRMVGIVDPAEEQLVAYRLEASRYRRAAVVTGEGVYEPELFPGLAIPLAELWL